MGATASVDRADPGIDISDPDAQDNAIRNDVIERDVPASLGQCIQAFDAMRALFENEELFGAIARGESKKEILSMVNDKLEKRLNLPISGTGGMLSTNVAAANKSIFFLFERDDSDDSDDSDAEQEEELNLRSDREPWAPANALFAGRTLTFNLSVIRFHDSVRRYGLGRYFCNAVQQGLTRNSVVPWSVLISVCHFPIFYTIDSFYGWLRTKSVPAGTPAGLIYPRHYPVTDTQQEAENEKAYYAYTDLTWSTPLTWAYARSRHILVRFNASPSDDLYRFWDRLNAKMARIGPSHAKHRITSPDAMARSIYFEAFAFASTAISTALATEYMNEAASIHDHCKVLGNSDVGLTPALYLYRGSFVPAAARAFKDCVVMVELILGYLIDHCRVMYRPIVIADALALDLQALFEQDSLNDVMLAMQTLPRPRPYFTRMGGHWVWVPVKKPHSSSYDGQTYMSLPTQESPPTALFARPDDTRPEKRARNFQAPCINV